MKSRPKKKFVPPVKIVGNLLTERNQEVLKEKQEKSDNKEMVKNMQHKT